VATLGRVSLGELLVVVVSGRSMDRLLKDGLGLIDLELGLEVVDVVREAAAVGATAGVGEGKTFVNYLLANTTPVALAAAVLLDLLGVDVGVATLGEEAWEVVDRDGGALGNALVVTVVGFVGSSHVEGQ